MVAAAWLLSLALSTPQLFIFSLQESPSGAHHCWGTFQPEWTLKVYVTWTSAAIYIIPSILLAMMYGRICYKVWKSSKGKEPRCVANYTLAEVVETGLMYQKMHFRTLLVTQTNGIVSKKPNGPRCHVIGGMARSKVKTVKLTLTVILCYLMCWSPFFVTQMWAAWDPDAPFEGETGTCFRTVSTLL